MDTSSSVLDYGVRWRQSAGGACFFFSVSFFYFFLFPADDYIKMSKLFVTSKHVIIRPISVANNTELLRLAAMDSDEK